MRKRISVFILVFICAGLFAVPGVKALIPDLPGQYVYYRDYTFPEEAYLGFLRYDEETYAARLITCKDGNILKDVTSYISMDSSADHIELTGEKIVGAALGTGDVDILNYLHDFIYEFAGRRKKLNDRDFSTTLVISDDYPQFGGSVKIEYDFYIPLFNVSNIRSSNGKTLFEIVCTGSITADSDAAFSSFKGIPKIESSSVYSDELPEEEWVEQSDYLWTLGEKAIYTTDYIACDDETFSAENGYTLLQYYARMLTSSTNYYYVLLDDADILIDDDSLFFVYEIYDIETGTRQKTIKRLYRMDSSLFEATEENYNYYAFSEIIADSEFYNKYEDYLFSVINGMMQ
ncbi:MAG: hypothetical protein K5930_00685 [Treponemataceae bacterium]|nr:hypothetical protein [Treponemataceae bacterium]